ncbi:NusG domain II-containing protein [Anaerosporobacter sp.]|uniref:NusG domain II-containing protein n=1 Tax=Anaerosporobacter sp. TaxID=1872529 RepID=UPI00286EB559|nr:NusG domain II-containing protein [Anaerosporobacter sp.]
MKKNDFVLIACLLVVIGVFLVVFQYTSKAGEIAVVKVEGEVMERLPLNIDTEIVVTGKNGGTNKVIVKDGYVSVAEASCPDHYCVKHKKIKKDKETIVCLPNEVVVEIEGKTKNELDTIAR